MLPEPLLRVPRRRTLLESRATALAEQPRLKIETPRLHGSIDLSEQDLDDLTLANYHETVDPKSPEVELLSPPGTQDPYLAEFGWVAVTPDVKVPGPQTRWTTSGGPLTPANPGHPDLGQRSRAFVCAHL